MFAVLCIRISATHNACMHSRMGVGVSHTWLHNCDNMPYTYRRGREFTMPLAYMNAHVTCAPWCPTLVPNTGMAVVVVAAAVVVWCVCVCCCCCCWRWDTPCFGCSCVPLYHRAEFAGMPTQSGHNKLTRAALAPAVVHGNGTRCPTSLAHTLTLHVYMAVHHN